MEILKASYQLKQWYKNLNCLTLKNVSIIPSTCLIIVARAIICVKFQLGNVGFQGLCDENKYYHVCDGMTASLISCQV